MENPDRIKTGKPGLVWVLAWILAFIPILKAGMMEPASLILCVSVALALLLFLTIDRKYFPEEINLKPWLAVFITVTVWIALQLFVFPLLFGWKPFFFDSVHPSFRAGPVNVLQSLHYWALFCAYWWLAYLVSILSKKNVSALLWVVLAGFFFQAIYGLIAYYGNHITVLGIWEKIAYRNTATGTFVNHSHYGGFLALCFPLVVSFLLAPLKDKPRRLGPIVSRVLILFFVVGVFIFAIIAASSRGAVVATTVAIFVWVLIIAGRGQKKPWLIRLIVFFIFLCLVVIVISVFSSSGFMGKFTTWWRYAGRIELWKAFADFNAVVWLWGVGAGAFADAYQLVHSLNPFVGRGVVQEAHNEYLQFLIEFGIMGTILIIIAGCYWAKSLWPKGSSLIIIGSVAGTITILVHSTVDFNLQIPGVATYFWFSVGCLFNSNLVEIRKVRTKVRTKVRIRKRSHANN